MSKVIRIAAILALLAITGLWVLPVSADTMMDSYNTGFDGNATIYGASWKGQTFTTSTSYYVTSVTLNLFRIETPGNLTVSLYQATGGLPVGSPFSSGIYDGDTLGNNTPGNVSITMSPYMVLAAYVQYAIVLSAPSGNATSYVGWMMDSTSPSYAGGSRLDSANSGLTWTIDTSDDFMFEVWGAAWVPAPSQIQDAIVISNVYEMGDWYIGIHYNNVESGYPDGDCAKLYSFVLFDGTLDVAKFPCPAWGYMPGSTYISSATRIAGNLTWEEADIGIELRNNTTGLAVYSYIFQAADWKGDYQSKPWEIDVWVRDTAKEIETYYGIDIYTETIPVDLGNKTLPENEGILTLVGCEIFSKGMHGLDELRPHLFYLVTHTHDMPDTDYSHIYSDTMEWTSRLGNQTVSDLNYAAAVVNMPSGKPLLGGLMFAGYLVLAGIGVWRLGSPAIAAGAAIPFLIGAIWIGVVPIAVGAILSLLMVIAFVWIVWLRST